MDVYSQEILKRFLQLRKAMGEFGEMEKSTLLAYIENNAKQAEKLMRISEKNFALAGKSSKFEKIEFLAKAELYLSLSINCYIMSSLALEVAND